MSDAVILELEGDRVLAVEARVRGDRVTVSKVVHATRGGEVPSEPEAVGAWVRGVLQEHGVRTTRAIIAVSRGELMIKRIDLPAGELSAAERHEAIHLQMERQASLSGGEPVIDYVPEDEGSGGGVLAAAMSGERVAWRRAMAKSAGLRLAGIRPRSAGIRAVLGATLAGRGPALVVAPGVGSVELLVISGGKPVFARSIDATMPGSLDRDTLDAFAERIGVESSRTWMSFRVSPAGEDVERVIVVASEPLGSALSESVSTRLDLPAEVVSAGALLEVDEGLDSRSLTATPALGGLLLCESRSVPVLDFANPRGAPDTRATLRQAVLGGILGLIVFGGAGYLLAQQSLASQRASLEAVREANKRAQDQYVAAMLEGARLGHLRSWTDQRIDWMGHLSAIVDRMPAPDEGAIADLSLELNQRARFKANATLNDPGAWAGESGGVVKVSGLVRDRRRVQEFRERLLGEGGYVVTSQGPEIDDRFAFQIVLPEPAPDGTRQERSRDGGGS
jgi:Tfp pilus assembly PilM family ATPase